MRITGGIWSSKRVLGPPKGWQVRPTPDALREQAFSILAPDLTGALFLDLFAGTGVVSLEALSRGATRAVLVENNFRSCELIRRNLALFGVKEKQAQLLSIPVAKALARLRHSGQAVDLAWADPPFDQFSLHLPSLALLGQEKILRSEGVLILECPPKVDPEIPGFFRERKLRGAWLFRLS